MTKRHMPMTRDDLSQLVSALGDGDADAFHTLIEAPHDIVPILIEEYQLQTDGYLRASLVEVIWQHRLPSTVPFLLTVLGDNHDEVWKQALDGLVTIGGDEVKSGLQKHKTQLTLADPKVSWIDEAREQLC